MTIKPVFPAKRLGEQCFYRASCTFADQHSTCTQVQHNAVCDCEEGYHRVSLSRPSKKVFCAEGISCQPIRHTHALQYSQYTVPVAQITIQRKLDVNLDFSFSMVLRNCCVYTCGEDEIKAFRFFFFFYNLLADLVLITTDIPTLLCIASGIAVFTAMICFVLKLFSRARYSRPRHYANANHAPPMLFSSDTGE